MKLKFKFLSFLLAFSMLFSSLSPYVFAEKNPITNALEVRIKTINPENGNINDHKIIVKDRYELINSIKNSTNDGITTYEVIKVNKNKDIPTQISLSGFEPTETVRIKHENITQDFYLSYNTTYVTPAVSEVHPRFVETVFDVGNFALSLYEYNQNPSFWTGFWLVVDGASVVLPGVPSINGVKRMIQGSDILKMSLEKGVQKYGQLQNVSPPPNWNGNGWERHHIFEQRWADKFGTTSYSMFAMFVPRDIHYNISNKLAQKLPSKWTSWMYTKDQIIDLHIDAYRELYAESGYDEFYEFIYEFSKTRQHTGR